MKIVIDISEAEYHLIKKLVASGGGNRQAILILGGTVLPKGHGDLIDRNAFIKKTTNLYCENCERRMGMKKGKKQFVYDIGDAPCRACEVCDLIDDVENAQTVIEADKENEND